MRFFKLYNFTTNLFNYYRNLKVNKTIKFLEIDFEYRPLINELHTMFTEDKKITISAGDVTTKPTTKDKVLISSIVHNIIRVLTKTSGGTDISYTLYLRT